MRQADWLLGLIERIQHEGTILKNAAKIQVGWSVLTMREQGNEVVILGPDFDGNPMLDTTEDLSLTLSVQAQQNDVLNRLRLEGRAALFQDKIVTARGALERERVYIERSGDPPKGDSGWYLGLVETDQGAGQLEAYQIYEMLRLRPALMQALALPTGYLVVFEGDDIAAVLNKDNIDLWSRVET